MRHEQCTDMIETPDDIKSHGTLTFISSLEFELTVFSVVCLLNEFKKPTTSVGAFYLFILSDNIIFYKYWLSLIIYYILKYNILLIFKKMVLKLREKWPVFTPADLGNGGESTSSATQKIIAGEVKEWSPQLPKRYKHIHSWKVRETYQHPDDPESFIMIATDRISTHDVIHNGLIPGKWIALTNMANYWFDYFSKHEDTKDIPTQLSETVLPDDFPIEISESAVVVKKLKALPIEAIVRWYLYGSALKWYNLESWNLETWEQVWEWLKKCSKFPDALFTPSTKEDSWDVNVDYNLMVQKIDEWLHFNNLEYLSAREIWAQVEKYSLNMYNTANSHAQEKWLILWDTKFEFGLDDTGKLHVIDEVCTADSSRLWEAESVIEWEEPIAKDKQPVRDYVMGYWKENSAEDGKKYPVQIIEMIQEVTAKRYDEISAIFS